MIRAAKETKQRVVDILLGQNNGSSINVEIPFLVCIPVQKPTDLLLVPFEEDRTEILADGSLTTHASTT